MLRNVRLDDAASICAIYNHYVLHTSVTFEEVALSTDDMTQRILQTTEALPWLVCEENETLLGYAYAHKWRERSAYRNSVELTIYLEPSSTRKGRGEALLQALLDDLRRRSIHCIIGGVALPNPASIALLEKCGMRKVAHFTEVGRKFDHWIDVGYWQLIL